MRGLELGHDLTKVHTGQLVGADDAFQVVLGQLRRNIGRQDLQFALEIGLAVFRRDGQRLFDVCGEGFYGRDHAPIGDLGHALLVVFGRQLRCFAEQGGQNGSSRLVASLAGRQLVSRDFLE